MWIIFNYQQSKKKYFVEFQGDETWEIVRRTLCNLFEIDPNVTLTAPTKPLSNLSETIIESGIKEMDQIQVTSAQIDATPATPALTGLPQSFIQPPKQQSKPAPTKTETYHAPIAPAVVQQQLKASAVPTPTNPTTTTTAAAGLGDPANFDELVNNLSELGFSKDQAMQALRNNRYDVNQAFNALDSGNAGTTTQAPAQTYQSTTTTSTQYHQSMKTQYDALSSSEKTAVDNLVKAGFSFSQSVEAYIVCDKNETNASNFLASN